MHLLGLVQAPGLREAQVRPMSGAGRGRAEGRPWQAAVGPWSCGPLLLMVVALVLPLMQQQQDDELPELHLVPPVVRAASRGCAQLPVADGPARCACAA